MRRDVVLYGLFVAVVALVVVSIRPRDDKLPRSTSFAWPSVAIEGLVVPGTPDYPGFVAAHAQPGSTGVVKLGGYYDRLMLRGVRVELATARIMTADAGEFSAGCLKLTGRVRVGERLEATRVEFRAGEARFSGVVVFLRPGSSRDSGGRTQKSAVDLRVSRRELLRLLR